MVLKISVLAQPYVSPSPYQAHLNIAVPHLKLLYLPTLTLPYTREQKKWSVYTWVPKCTQKCALVQLLPNYVQLYQKTHNCRSNRRIVTIRLKIYPHTAT